MEWTPQEEGLREILTLLRESKSPDTPTQRAIQLKLEELSKYPDFNNYLVFILTKMTIEDAATRSLSGIILKNNIKSSFSNLTPTVLNFVKQECLIAITDVVPIIRSTGSLIITTIVSMGELTTWPELLPALCIMVNSKNYIACEGAFSTLLKICEDSSCIETLETLLPTFIKFISHDIANVRSHAIGCVKQFLSFDSDSIKPHIEPLLQHLFVVLCDHNVEVRKNVCGSIVLIVESHIEKILPHIESVMEYMLLTMVDQNEELALEACEFWLSLAEQKICHDILVKYLEKLVPILINSMKYSDMEIAILNNEEDASVPDRAEDITPHFIRSKTRSINPTLSESDDDDFEEVPQWNLRKCSATTLDALAVVFKEHMQPVLVPILKETLFHSDWIVRESAILALGAVVATGMENHMTELIPYLLNCLNDSKALVRCITCWTISRYTHWVVLQDREAFLKPVVTGLLERILDDNKRVQKAACSAFAVLEEEACTYLVPYLEFILQTLVYAFSKYQHNNLLTLYDAVATLACSVEHHLNNPDYINLLMPPLIQKWNLLQDSDEGLSPLLECLSSIIPALKQGFLPFCDPVFKRCISLLEQTLSQDFACSEYPDQYDAPDKDLLIVSLDLLSGLAEGLNGYIEQFVIDSNIMQLLYYCLQDPLPEVRQAAFALLGDLTKSCFKQVQPYIPSILPILALNLDCLYVSVCNNATWALGEISIKLGQDTKSYIELVFTKLINNIHNPVSPRTLLENSAVTIGRLGFVCPDETSPQLNQLLRQCCRILRNIKDGDEKDGAFRGICEMIARNPTAAVDDFIYFCDAIASWIQPKEDLADMFRAILTELKKLCGAEKWNVITNQFPQQLTDRISALYFD